MTLAKMRFWFCVAAAVVAAAIADPLVEWASNAGFFGPGSYTDHSNLDVVPALLAGAVLLAAHLILRVRRTLASSSEYDLRRVSREALGSRPGKLLPAIFTLQMVVLFGMETCEQYAVAGHSLGAMVWLGGPIAVSLAVHALACVLVTFVLARALVTCTRETVRAIRFLRALAARPAQGMPPIALPQPAGAAAHLFTFVLCSVGERAPPIPAV